MPELPEVETIRRDLAPLLTGRQVVGVDVIDGKAVRQPEMDRFIEGLKGQVIEGVRRRGKYLLLPLSSGQTLVVHLKMTGALLWRPAGYPPDPHTRAVWRLDQGQEIRFADTRRLGNLWLVDAPALDSLIGELGPEPLDPSFTPQVLAARLGRRSAPIKATLLDQTMVAGLGNIYADESLWEAAIQPLRPAAKLATPEVTRLHEAIGQVLSRALANRGTSFSDYRDAQGRPGANQGHLRVYGRAGQACYRCGAIIQRMVLRGRSSYFCSTCQE